MTETDARAEGIMGDPATCTGECARWAEQPAYRDRHGHCWIQHPDQSGVSAECVALVLEGMPKHNAIVYPRTFLAECEALAAAEVRSSVLEGCRVWHPSTGGANRTPGSERG